MTDRIEIKAALSVDDAGTIEGIAWPFGTEDRVGDVIEKGAFAGAAVPQPMLWAHDQAQVVGVWDSVTETDAGLIVKGRLLIDDVARAREVRAMVKAGAATGLSIGFVTKSATPRRRGRTITALDLHEISVVAVPAHPGAKIQSVKTAAAAAPTPIGDTMEPETTPAVITATTPANDAPGIDTKALDAITARLDRMEAKANRPHGVTVTGPISAGNETKAFTNFMRTGDAAEVKSLAYGTGTGGILAPETVSTTILEKIAEFSPVRGLAQVIQMNGPLLQLPRLVTDVTVGAVAEGAAKAESEPTFEQIDLKPFEMGVIVPVTRTLLEDAQVDLSGYLADHVARRFGQQEAAWFVGGNGTTQAEGVLTSAEVQGIEVAAITADALIDHFYSLKTVYSSAGAWLMARQTMALVRKLKDADGQYLWQGALAAGQPATLLGRPVFEAVDMPAPIAGSTPIVFGDFASGYAIADRIGFEVIRDELTGASSSMVKFVARRRVGGRVVMGEALAKLTLAA